MKYIYILFLLCGLLSCHNSSRVDNKDIPPLYSLKIDKPDFSSLKPLLLSEFVDSIGYVQLETTPDCLLSHHDSGTIYGDLLFISSLSSILQFDANTGKFLRQIGRIGQGPGEYVQTMSVVIDNDNNIVYVQSPRPSFLLSYNFNGDYLGDLPFVDTDTEYPIFTNCFNSLMLMYIDNQYAIFRSSLIPKEEACQPFELIVYDYRNKKIKDTLANGIEGVANIVMGISGVRAFAGNEDGFFYKTFYNDTLYSVDVEKGIKPYAIIDLGKRKYPVEAVFDQKHIGKAGKIMIREMLINDDCIYLWCIFIEDESLRSTNRFLYKYDIPTGESSCHSTVILNDIDGGANTSIVGLLRGTDPVMPLDMVEEGSEEFLFSNVSKSELKYPELKEKFEMMQSNRDSEDNPLLMKFYMEKHKNE